MITREDRHHALRVALAALLVGAGTVLAQTPGLTLTNTDGGELWLREPPARIAVLGRGSFMIVGTAALFPGARERLRAAVDARQLRGENLEFLVSAGRVAPDLVLFGGEVGPEQLAPLRPDLVLLKSTSARLGDALEKIGLPAFQFDLETPEHYERELFTLGQILGDAPRAADLRSYYRERRTRIAARLTDLPSEQRPRVLLVQTSARAGTRAFRVPAAEWLQTRLVEMAGGLPVWRDATQRSSWTVISLEQAAVWNPEILLVVDYGEGDPETASLIRTDRTWQKLEAVRNRRVWTFPGDLVTWDQPDPRWALGLMWVAKRLHPERFADLDLWAEVVTFYRWYGLTESDVDARIKPRLRGDWQ
ncbi:MAG: ABC transporter substrate-binding protein [Verrucomicrobia bacterium]|nr:ABC transporter substrate-binding protein [Verrucomicrobiota bacterium]